MRYLEKLSRLFATPKKRRKLIAEAILWSAPDTPHYQGKIDQVNVVNEAPWDGEKFILHYLETHNFDPTDTNCNELAKWMEVYPGKLPADRDKLTKWLEVRA